MYSHSPYRLFFGLWLVFILVCATALRFSLSLAWAITIPAAVNLATFFLFFADKSQASSKNLRVPERILFLATFLGGPIGALLGMHVFRHKTKKASFQLVIVVLILIQLLLIVLILKPELLGISPTLLPFPPQDIDLLTL